MDLLPQILVALALFVSATAYGVREARRLIERYEARSALQDGSASRLRIMAGWWPVLLWLALVWFVSAYVADWAVSGDPYGAFLSSVAIVFFIADMIGTIGF